MAQAQINILKVGQDKYPGFKLTEAIYLQCLEKKHLDQEQQEVMDWIERSRLVKTQYDLSDAEFHDLMCRVSKERASRHYDNVVNRHLLEQAQEELKHGFLPGDWSFIGFDDQVSPGPSHALRSSVQPGVNAIAPCSSPLKDPLLLVAHLEPIHGMKFMIHCWECPVCADRYKFPLNEILAAPDVSSSEKIWAHKLYSCTSIAIQERKMKKSQLSAYQMRKCLRTIPLSREEQQVDVAVLSRLDHEEAFKMPDLSFKKTNDKSKIKSSTRKNKNQ